MYPMYSPLYSIILYVSNVFTLVLHNTVCRYPMYSPLLFVIHNTVWCSMYPMYSPLIFVIHNTVWCSIQAYCNNSVLILFCKILGDVGLCAHGRLCACKFCIFIQKFQKCMFTLHKYTYCNLLFCIFY